MTATFKTAAIAFIASVAGAAPARAQMQPPPFDAQGATAPTRTPPPAAAPRTPAQPAAAPRTPAQPADDDTIDDPKVSRRLGTRITVPPPPAPPPPAPPRAPAPAPRVAAPVAPVAPVEPIAPLPPAPPPTDADGSTPTIVRSFRPAQPTEAEEPFQSPRVKLSWRRFDFVQIGASASSNGVAAPETFNSIAVDVYPVSSVVRVGLTSSYGWQSGQWLANGDYFAMQSFSFGGQYRDLGRVVPFAEAYTGVGYMRRLQFDRSIPTAFWHFGADAGVEVHVARVGYLSLAFGYIRPVNGFAKRQQFTTIFVDTWSFKLGVGI